MNKKYIIISIVSVLVILIGVTIAYYSAVITGDRKKITINTKELQVVFHNGEEINETEIEAPWETSKEFSVESKSPDIFYYNIVLQDLINGFTSNTLEYKITCTNGRGYSMDNFAPVPQSSEKSDQILIEGIELQPKATHTYKIEFRYLNSNEIDQSDDMGKTLSGNLYITKGAYISNTLADIIMRKFQVSYMGERKHFDQTVGTYDEEDGYDKSGLYSIDGNFTENGNKVYYFSGNVENNWVEFAGYYWRIIRTNEDGSLRLLYAGLAEDKGYSTEQYIGGTNVTVAFNNSYQDPMYVGFKYSFTGSLVNNRGNYYSSTILGPDEDTYDSGNYTTLNGWYNRHIKSSDGHKHYWDDYVSKTAIYCNDRATNEYILKSRIDFAMYNRLLTNKHPSFKCGVDYNGDLIESVQAEEDKFSGKNSKARLTNPIGLITADEVAYAGGVFSQESKGTYYYLTADKSNSATGTNGWWTMSPFYYSGNWNQISFVSQTGAISSDESRNSKAVRPVLSLKSCVNLTDASGTADDPFVVWSISNSCAAKDN